MVLLRGLAALVLSGLLVDASSTPPVPNQPRLVSVRLVGTRVCGDFHLPDKTYTFTCDPLPTVNATGWQLTPARRSLDANGHKKLNRIAVLTIATPTVTEIDLQYEPRHGLRVLERTAASDLRRQRPSPQQPAGRFPAPRY
jgi:hypothetical protein